ncbi:Retroviral aspartyl protease [compost metagenome]
MKQLIILISLILIFASSGFSAAFSLDECDMLLFGSKNSGYVLYTPAYINDAEHLAFIDTGASVSSIYKTGSIGFTASGSIKTNGVLGPGVSSITSIDSINIIGSTHSNQRFLVKDDPHSGQGLPVHASMLIGADVLCKMPLMLDFSNERIKHLTVKASSPGVEVRSLFVKNIPMIEVLIQGEKFFAVMDTGATISAVDKKALKSSQGVKFEYLRSENISDIFKNSRVSSIMKAEINVIPEVISKASIVELDLSNIAEVLGVKVDLILGMDFISQYDWIIDYPTQRIFCSRSHHP